MALSRYRSQGREWAVGEHVLDERMEDLVVLMEAAKQIGQSLRSDATRAVSTYSTMRRNQEQKIRDKATEELNAAHEAARLAEKQEQARQRVEQASASQTEANLRDSSRSSWWDEHTLAEIARVEASARHHAQTHEHIAIQYPPFARRLAEIEKGKLFGELRAGRTDSYWKNIDAKDVVRTVGYIEKYGNDKNIRRLAPEYYAQAHKHLDIPLSAFVGAVSKETIDMLSDQQIQDITPQAGTIEVDEVRESVVRFEERKKEKIEAPTEWHDPVVIKDIQEKLGAHILGGGQRIAAKFTEENRVFEAWARENPENATQWAQENPDAAKPEWLTENGITGDTTPSESVINPHVSEKNQAEITPETTTPVARDAGEEIKIREELKTVLASQDTPYARARMEELDHEIRTLQSAPHEPASPVETSRQTSAPPVDVSKLDRESAQSFSLAQMSFPEPLEKTLGQSPTMPAPSLPPTPPTLPVATPTPRL